MKLAIKQMLMGVGLHFGDEIIENGGFETAGAGGADAFANWVEFLGDGAIARTTTAGEFYAGVAAAKLTAGATANTQLYESRTVVPGQKYRYAFYTRGDGTYAGRYAIYDNTNSAYIVNITATGIIGTSYQRKFVDFTAPAGCIAVLCSVRPPATNTGIAYFDNVSLRAVNP